MNPAARERSAAPGRPGGFTLLELLVVVAIVAIASTGVSFALRDNRQDTLEREAQRLVALLEAARAQSRMAGQPLRWVPDTNGFRLEGLGSQPRQTMWLNAATQVRADGGASTTLVLGPEPLIGAQSLLLTQGDLSRRIGTDGLRPFAVLP